MLKRVFNIEQDSYGFKTIFHILIAIMTMLIGNMLASLPFDIYYSNIGYAEPTLVDIIVNNTIRPLLSIAFTLLLMFLYIKKGFMSSVDEFRIKKPKTIITWIICGLALPAVVSCFFIICTPGTMQYNDFDNVQLTRIILGAIFSSCLVAGITEEIVFRGFVMRILEKRWNKYVAIFVPSVLFALLHVFSMDMPSFLDLIMLTIAGSAVGVMFSLITYQSESIWPAAIVHGLWNLIIIGGILEIGGQPGKALFTFTLNSESVILTGGSFGIESSIPATIGYLLISLIAYMLLNKNNRIHA